MTTQTVNYSPEVDPKNPTIKIVETKIIAAIRSKYQIVQNDAFSVVFIADNGKTYTIIYPNVAAKNEGKAAFSIYKCCERQVKGEWDIFGSGKEGKTINFIAKYIEKVN